MPNTRSFARRWQRAAILLAVSLMVISCQFVTQTGAPKTAAQTALPPAPLAVKSPLARPTIVPSPLTAGSPATATVHLASPTPPSSGATGQIEALDYIYQQDFASTPQEWNLDPYDSERGSVRYRMQDGVFRWQITTQQGMAVWNHPDPSILLPQGDFLVTVTLDFGASGVAAAGGLLFRMQDGNNFYYAKLNQAGEVAIFALDNGEWQRLTEPAQSEKFVTGKPNRLIVQQRKGVYEIQVNDSPVISFRDNRFQGGKIGLIVDLDGGIETVTTFDDLRVMRPTQSGAVVNDQPGRPTLMPLGASYQTFSSNFQGVPYSIDHPFVFVPSQAGGWQRLCLDAPEHLCVSIQPHESTWNSVEAMADEIMTSFGATVVDYQVIHSQSTKTVMEGTPAYWVGYTCTWQNQKLQGSRLFIVAQGVGFDIAAEGDPVMMEIYQVVIKNMLESFRLKEN